MGVAGLIRVTSKEVTAGSQRPVGDGGGAIPLLASHDGHCSDAVKR